MVSASVSAYTAPTLMAICLLTDYWIYGRQTRLASAPITKAGDVRILNFTYHRIGLWRECSRETTNVSYTCEVVRYSKAEAKLEKGFKAVSYRSAPIMACFTAASSLLLIAIVLFSRGLCKRRRKAVFFISGLLFSISGLLTMVGVTLYVSVTTEEEAKIDQDVPVMQCFYGYSFICAVLSFVLQELTGVLTVYWFIYRFRALVRKQEKLRERTRQLMGNCLSMTTALPLNLVSMEANHNKKSIAHRPNQNHYPSQVDAVNSYGHKHHGRRLPFDRGPPVLPPQNENNSYRSLPSRSPTLIYGDYCRVLIRAEDMDLLAKMVKSKSQAQLSRPTTPAATITNVKVLPAPTTQRHIDDQPTRRSTRKSFKRTTSV
ncbi:unnamed protein product [Adineta ricciae]|uniref:Uncharacterized protein n=1 Tax=Adineta ricciae TaxID=249248 RepID=A0A813VI70_ADIRI|nr:unnamed protein product [Adineta ricciae]CAF1130878.1 unnamed protein product [Adineta ricciae]